MVTRPLVRVDIVSDTVCPWCLIGKRRLETAMKPYSDKLEFQVWWHPFQLNPDAPQQGINKLQYYRSKFGAQADLIIPRMTQTFAQEGMKYNIGGLTGNTLNSHLLIHWAGKTAGWQTQNKLVEELFINYFCEEKYINDRQVLLAAVKKAGLDVATAEKVLDNPGGVLDEVNAALKQARMQSISGVPFFTINDRFTLSGAQPPSEFMGVFEEIVRTSTTAVGNVQGAVCLPGQDCQ